VFTVSSAFCTRADILVFLANPPARRLRRATQSSNNGNFFRQQIFFSDLRKCTDFGKSSVTQQISTQTAEKRADQRKYAPAGGENPSKHAKIMPLSCGYAPICMLFWILGPDTRETARQSTTVGEVA
jgi:hypothetical protein